MPRNNNRSQTLLHHHTTSTLFHLVSLTVEGVKSVVADVPFVVKVVVHIDTFVVKGNSTWLLQWWWLVITVVVVVVVVVVVGGGSSSGSSSAFLW